MSGTKLSRERMRQALVLLAEKLNGRGVIGEVHAFGMHTVLLAFDARATTTGLDELFVPEEHVHAAARAVAIELDLAPSWLLHQAATFVSRSAGRSTPVFDHPNLRVMRTPPAQLLALKVRAARATGDARDVRLLVDFLYLRDVPSVTDALARTFPDEPLDDRDARLLAGIFAEGARPAVGGHGVHGALAS